MRATRRELKTIFEKAFYRRYYERRRVHHFDELTAKNRCMLDPDYLPFFVREDRAATNAMIDTLKKARRMGLYELHQDQ